MDEAAFTKAYLKKFGIRVVFVSQDIPDGHIGKLIERIFEWNDEYNAIRIGQDAFEGQRQVTSRGYHGGGKAPYGYKRVRVDDPDGKTDKDGQVVQYTTYEVVPDEAEVVRRVFQMYADGFSYKKVAHALNPEGIRSPGGSTWDISAVRTILLNENYRGHRVWNQTRRNKKLQRGTKVAKPRSEWVISENAHEAIVDPELWDRVQARRGKIRVHMDGKGDATTARSLYLLTGTLKCDECGANYVMSKRSKNGIRLSGSSVYISSPENDRARALARLVEGKSKYTAASFGKQAERAIQAFRDKGFVIEELMIPGDPIDHVGRAKFGGQPPRWLKEEKWIKVLPQS